MGSLFRRFIGSKRPSCSDWYLLLPWLSPHPSRTPPRWRPPRRSSRHYLTQRLLATTLLWLLSTMMSRLIRLPTPTWTMRRMLPRPRLSSLLPSRTRLLEVWLPCRLPLQSTRLPRLSQLLLQPPPLWPPWPSLTLLTTTSSPPPPTWPATLTTALPTTASPTTASLTTASLTTASSTTGSLTGSTSKSSK